MGYTKDEVINTIMQAAIDNGHDNPCAMVAMANIETGGKFNPNAKNGSYAGPFQLSNGIGGCTGSDRNDPYKATQCAMNYIEKNREQVEKRIGTWEDWMAYLAHQQGAAGFAYLYLHQDSPINTLPTKNQKAIKTNTKKGWSQYYVCDFLNNWKNTYEGITNQCNVDLSACPTVEGLSGASCSFSSVSPTPQADKNTMQTILKVSAAITVLGLVGYIFSKDIKKMVK